MKEWWQKCRRRVDGLTLAGYRFEVTLNMKVEEFIDPYLERSWQQLGARVLSSGKRISVTLGYPAMGMQAQLQKQLAEFLGVDDIELELRFAADHGRGFNQVKNIVLVA
ncbi:MAG: hypothetical protein VYC77_11870, partial [Pseudomonadota bacterium]|nr:hypothetical protein [Pseudomonadota bacterium]